VDPVRRSVTVVIPTYRRPASVVRALSALATQDAPFDWDVVVVDNDASQSARDAVEQVGRAGLDLRYEVEPLTGVAHARNRGVAVASGDVVALLDDDVVPQPGWLANVCAPVLAGAASATGGTVRLDPTVTRPRWFDEAGIGGYLASFGLAEGEHELGDRDLLLTANMAVLRAALDEVGGFDPTFGPRGGVQLVADDAHLVRQLVRHGHRVVYRSDAVVVHDLPPQRLTRRYLLRRAYLQGRSDWLLERIDHADRRFGGLRVAVVHVTRWLRRETRQRLREGLRHSAVRFHLLCDVARFVGTLRQALFTVTEKNSG
jgi:GT2 family glycosyltransferase